MRPKCGGDGSIRRVIGTCFKTRSVRREGRERSFSGSAPLSGRAPTAVGAWSDCGLKPPGLYWPLWSPWNRRDFLRASLGLTGLSLLAGCGVLSAPGQRTARMPRIGFLAPAHRATTSSVGLREHGYERGAATSTSSTASPRARSSASRARGRAGRPAARSPRGDRRPGEPRRQAGHQHHPDRCRRGPRPRRSGLVASLARPGGNVTGFEHLGR